MDKREKENMLCGEITAFLSMIFFLVLALVGTTLEAARVEVGKSMADRSLQNSLESLYTEYCVQLWEDYHLFFLESEKAENKDEDYIRNSLYTYMDYTYNEENIKLPSMDLIDMKIQQIDVIDIIRADEKEGELLLHEILEYEKYQVDEVFLSNQKKVIQAMKEMNASVTVIEKQMEAEEKMAEVNLEALKFISAIEGISVGRNGFQWKRNGLLQTENYFVKQFCNSDITRNDVGIDNETVWKSLQASYVNPILLIEKMEKEATQIVAEAELQNESGSYIKLKQLEKELIIVTKGMLRQAEKAQRILTGIQEKQSVFMEEAEEFEAVYRGQEADLSDESKMAFEEEIKRLKGFAGAEKGEFDSLINRITGMKSSLENNIVILKEILRLEQIGINNNPEDILIYIDELAELKGRILDYKTKEMQFDYSSLSAEKRVEDPTEALPDGYEKNLLEMVIKNVSDVSSKTKGTQDFNASWEGFGQVENILDEQLKKVLLSHYIENHFNCYMGKVSEKETVLDYEVEYILGGKRSDKDNLEEVIKKIVKLRTICNYLYLITDREKVELAYGAAVALVGYSGMEPLIQLTKNLILMTWATEEAVVDAAALLQDRKVPIFKTKTTFLIGFEELLLFEKELVHQKVAEMTNAVSGMDYEEYLNLFLNFKNKKQKLDSIMELVEENMQLRYDKDFDFGNCIYGTEVLVKFHMEEKFVRLPGVQEILNISGEGFEIQSHCSYCYE